MIIGQEEKEAVKNSDNYFDLKGKEFNAFSSESKEEILKSCLSYWRDKGFPYYDKDDAKFEKEIMSLKGIKNSDIFDKSAIKNKVNGLKIANFFNPQLWHVKVKNAYSPIERFYDDKALTKILINSAKMWPDRYSFRPGSIRSSIRLYSKTRAVTNFYPAIAKAIIKRYSNDNDTVVDFSSGFGGRLLGCLVLNRKYIGIDPSFAQINGCKSIYEYCSTNFKNVVRSSIQLFQSKAEEKLEEFEDEFCSLVFSSPPYFDHERYEDCKNQSHINYNNYEDWRTNFLIKIINESYRILKKNGYLIVHLKNVNGHDLVLDFISEANKKFTLKKIYKKEVKRRPYRYIDKYNGSYNYEKIIVMKKV
ncbi:DNA methyltransferase [Ulvibacter antarcticus]|uniref:DNA methylase n=1 Tax=Ulvibacter antarcticus TaxID=442714 RepID=A0A3L9YWV3_9FLAO|nr:DNA methyltransferase [Ulvibacter antarcticus]RMA64307.1 DNA methylase [Ulvibacter antarcticus]